MTGLIYLIGFLFTAFIIYLLVEVVFNNPSKGALSEAHTMAGASRATRLQQALSPLGVPVQKYAPPAFLRSMSADLYWAQMANKWVGWNAVQLVALRENTEVFLADVCTRSAYARRLFPSLT